MANAQWIAQVDRQTARLPPSMWTMSGSASTDDYWNPNGSLHGHRGHHQPRRPACWARWGTRSASGDGSWYMNVPGNKYQPLFEGGVDYFK